MANAFGPMKTKFGHPISTAFNQFPTVNMDVAEKALHLILSQATKNLSVVVKDSHGLSFLLSAAVKFGLSVTIYAKSRSLIYIGIDSHGVRIINSENFFEMTNMELDHLYNVHNDDIYFPCNLTKQEFSEIEGKVPGNWQH
jgi:hypothetical protein